MFGEINTIAIPTDAIFIIFLLIVFLLLGYCLNNISSNGIKELSKKIDFDSNLELVRNKLDDQLTYEAATLIENNLETPRIKQLNSLVPSQLFGIGSFALITIGATSLLGLQHMQKSYESVNTSSAKIKLQNETSRSPSFMTDLQQLFQIQTNIKKISYIDPFFSTITNSKDNHYYQVKEKPIEKIFSI